MKADVDGRLNAWVKTACASGQPREISRYNLT
jgi:hypothetical protein